MPSRRMTPRTKLSDFCASRPGTGVTSVAHARRVSRRRFILPRGAILTAIEHFANLREQVFPGKRLGKEVRLQPMFGGAGVAGDRDELQGLASSAKVLRQLG